MAANVHLLNQSWTVITESLTPGKKYASSPDCVTDKRVPDADFEQAIDVLCQNDLAYIIEDWFIECAQQDLRKRVGPAFWETIETTRGDGVIQCLSRAVSNLHMELSLYFPCVRKLDLIRETIKVKCSEYSNKKTIRTRDPGELQEFLTTLYKAVIFHNAPLYFREIVDEFYEQAFKVFHHISGEDKKDADESKQDNDDQMCIGCGRPLESCSCEEIMEILHSVNRKLGELGILETLSGSAVTNLIHQRIKQHIEHTCKMNFETPFLSSLEQWLDDKVLCWLNMIYANTSVKSEQDWIQAFRGRLLHLVYETYACLTIDHLFTIIIEFPESEPALQDLKICLEKTDLREHLTMSLRNALESRLLHPGVNTTDILTAYISAIRALRVLDPSGVVLERVCEPVRKYLRFRDDTVRCIVSSLTDDGSSELSDELFRAHPLVLEDTADSDDDMDNWQNWKPDPRDACPDKTSGSRRASDIISMLINIYGSKELFVNEYRTLLAERILTNFSFETEKEIRYLELLKLRFGETQLHNCEVMLKDVADSKRINSHINEAQKKADADATEYPLSAMILSAQFWPTFREEKVTLPASMKQSLDVFTEKFAALKGNRTLDWKSHLGQVSIDVEVKDRTLEFTCSPVHAAIIMQFESQQKWTTDELCAVLEMPPSSLRRKIAYWQSVGLLREETPDTFILTEEQKGPQHEVMMAEEDEGESVMASQQSRREEELQVFWTYIVGMLTNLDSLPLDRIHSMLKMFAMQGPSTSEISLGELKAFLDRQVKEQLLVHSAGVYRMSR